MANIYIPIVSNLLAKLAGIDYSRCARIMDWGGYVRWDGAVLIPFERLVELKLLDCFICKGGQKGEGLSTKANIDAAKAAGVALTGCFYWPDPTGNPQVQLEYIAGLVQEENPDLIILDNEQWWADWNLYEAYLRGEIGIDKVPKLAPRVISECNRIVAQGLRKRFPGKVVKIYTSKSFVVGWAAPMAEWLPEFDGGFVASWPDYGKAIYYLSWDQIRAYPAAGYKPDLPPGWTKWGYWQTSSRIRPAEFKGNITYDHNYDLGIYNGTVEDMLVEVGKKPPVAQTWEQAMDAWARGMVPPFTGPRPG